MADSAGWDEERQHFQEVLQAWNDYMSYSVRGTYANM